jgi:hypothetical protein
MKPISIISQDLFDKVRSRFSNLEMGDETGAVVIDPEQARFFDFDFVFEGSNLGRVSISINDPGSLKVYFSQGITENQDDSAKKQWFNFLREMRFFAMRRLLRFDTRDIAKTNLDKNDFQHLAKTQAPKEPDMTTMNESKNKSRVLESIMSDIDIELRDIVSREDHDALYDLFTANTPAGKYIQNMYDDIVIDNRLHPDDDFEQIEELVWDRLENDFGGDYTDYSMRRGEMGMEEDMETDSDSLTFWNQAAQKAGSSANIDWYAIGVEHGKSGVVMNPPYGIGAKALNLYDKGMDAGKQGVAEGVSLKQKHEDKKRADQNQVRYGKMTQAEFDKKWTRAERPKPTDKEQGVAEDEQLDELSPGVVNRTVNARKAQMFAAGDKAVAASDASGGNNYNRQTRQAYEKWKTENPNADYNAQKAAWAEIQKQFQHLVNKDQLPAAQQASQAFSQAQDRYSKTKNLAARTTPGSSAGIDQRSYYESVEKNADLARMLKHAGVPVSEGVAEGWVKNALAGAALVGAGNPPT